jgi:hypothetical protein
MVTVRDLHQLHLYVNRLIDDNVSPPVDEVVDAALSGQLVDYLDNEFDAFAPLGGHEEVLDIDGLNELFANYFITDAREHLLVENNGLLVLSGSIMEVLSLDVWDLSTAEPDRSGLLDIEFVDSD